MSGRALSRRRPSLPHSAGGAEPPSAATCATEPPRLHVMERGGFLRPASAAELRLLRRRRLHLWTGGGA